MKTLNITFTDGEFKKLLKAKKLYCDKQKTSMAWHKYLIHALTKGVSIKRRLI